MDDAAMMDDEQMRQANRSTLAEWPITRLAMVRDREAEVPGGPPLVCLATLSAFCPQCATRRGAAVLDIVSANGASALVSSFASPCGHLDTQEHLRAEVALQCAAYGCVIMASDAHWPFCSGECALLT